MKCIIVDDEPKAIEVLQRYVEKISDLILLASFRDPLKAIEFIKLKQVDLIFLDINMPGLSGLQFTKLIAPGPMIIFTTAYQEHAIASYEAHALDYLLKPIPFDRFLMAVHKAQDQWNLKRVSEKAENLDFIVFKSGNLMYRVTFEELLFLEKDGNYFTVYAKDKKFLIRQNMKDISEMLPADRFVRVHKSFVVSCSKIDVIESHQLRIGNYRIPIGKMYRGAVQKMIGSHII